MIVANAVVVVSVDHTQVTRKLMHQAMHVVSKKSVTGIETDADVAERRGLLRDLGYKL